MAALYISIILLFRVVQAVFNKMASNEVKNIPTVLVYGAYRNAISAAFGLMLVLISGNGFGLGAAGLLISLCSGVMLSVSGYCGIMCLKTGTVSVSSIFSTAGILIPIIAGVFFGIPVSAVQCVGLALFFVSAFLLIRDSRNTTGKFTAGAFFLLVGCLFAEGLTMLSQQAFTKYVPDGSVSAFSFITFCIAALSNLIMFAFFRNKNVPVPGEEKTGKGSPAVPAQPVRFSRRLTVCGVALAVAVFVINQFATMSTALVPPVILFTFINGGGTVISTVVAAIMYKEKLTPQKIVGVAVGIASLVIVKMF